MLLRMVNGHTMLSPATDEPLEPIVWTPDMAVGIPEIDDEHATLVALYNDLVHALQRGVSLFMNHSMMQSLLSYLSGHMDREEGYIRRHAFPDADAHFREHREVKVALRVLAAHPPDGSAAGRAARRLRGWVLHHILVSDRALFDHVRRSGGALSVPPASRGAHP